MSDFPTPQGLTGIVASTQRQQGPILTEDLESEDPAIQHAYDSNEEPPLLREDAFAQTFLGVRMLARNHERILPASGKISSAIAGNTVFVQNHVQQGVLPENADQPPFAVSGSPFWS